MNDPKLNECSCSHPPACPCPRQVSSGKCRSGRVHSRKIRGAKILTFSNVFDSSNDHRVVIFKVFGATARTGRIDAGRRIDFHRLLAAELVDSDRRRL
jgi:hypothetical protein